MPSVFPVSAFAAATASRNVQVFAFPAVQFAGVPVASSPLVLTVNV